MTEKPNASFVIELVNTFGTLTRPCPVCGEWTDNGLILAEDEDEGIRIRVCERCQKSGKVDEQLEQSAEAFVLIAQRERDDLMYWAFEDRKLEMARLISAKNEAKRTVFERIKEALSSAERITVELTKCEAEMLMSVLGPSDERLR